MIVVHLIALNLYYLHWINVLITMRWLVWFILMMPMLQAACKKEHAGGAITASVVDTVAQTAKPPIDYDTTQWKELTAADGVILDIRYATSNNFVKEGSSLSLLFWRHIRDPKK